MLVSKVPMARAVSVISLLSMPMRGRRMGRSWAQSVHCRAFRVWLATWARLSPVMMASHSISWAMREAMRIMLRRISTVNSTSGAWSRMYSCGAV